MSIGKWLAVAVAALAPLGAADAVPKEDPHQRAAERMKGDGGTPFQRALDHKLKERKQNGKKIPTEVQYEFDVVEAADGTGWGPGDCETPRRCPKAGYVVKAVGRTTVKFGGPDEAHEPGPGQHKAKWPAVVLRGKPDDPDFAADYTADYKREAQLALLGDPAEGAPPLWKDPENPDAGGVWDFGEEPQEDEIEEEITFTFPQGQEQARAFFRALAAASAGDAVSFRQVLMGFTYSGPNVDYTIGSKKRACLFGACVTLWDIRAGFAMDWALGLRLPATSELSGPALMVAGQTYDFFSTMAAADWDADAYGAVGAAREGGDEYVMRMGFFAGAKVKILGADVCPWCQYVEFDEDYGDSFTTPFGVGERFPLPTLELELKRWDYGIVALGLGLTITPDVGSSRVTAMANGAALAHTAPATPVPFAVKACIVGGSHQTTVQLDAYAYWFNLFVLRLGAYLDFQVFGYGAWNPHFSIIDLDLSGALGSLGLYVGDHVQCDWAFNCTPAPAVQQVSLTAQLVDQSAPTTTLALAGTPGTHGWWTSDVGATLAATDNPPDCGIGVQTTRHGLSADALFPGTAFTLADEGVATVHYGSIDADGNVEPLDTEVVSIDKTPPTVAGAPTSSPNGNGWYRTDVTVHFTASDAVSGVETLTADQVLSAEAADQSVTGTAVDFAGLSASYTVSDIDIDKSAPAVTLSVPAPTGYANTDTFHVTWTASDGLSGIASEGATLDGAPVANGQLVELIYLGGGNHEVRVSATDRADNVGEAAATFLVDVDIDGLLAAVDRVCELGWVKPGVCNGLRAKVLEARESIALGAKTDARGQLGAFLNELDAQRFKGISEKAYALLRVDALYVRVRYGLVEA